MMHGALFDPATWWTVAAAAAPAEEAVGLFRPDPIVHLGWRTTWLLWALLAVIVVYALIDDALRARRSRREAAGREGDASDFVLLEPRTDLHRRHDRRISPIRRTWSEGRLAAPPGEAEAAVPARRTHAR